MKKFMLTTISILLLFTLIGCNNNKPEETEDNTIVNQPVEETEDNIIDNQPVEETSNTEADSKVDSAADSEAAPTDAPASITGIIQDATMNTITIKTAEDVELNFMTEDADKTKCNGLIIGSSVDIFYTGQIDGTDTSNVTVTAMEQPSEQ